VSPDPFVVYGIAGSLRKESWNRKLLHAAAALAPEGVKVQITTLFEQMPLLNEDLVGNEPEPVLQMRAEVAAADALLIATPEYNGAVPGVLKNTLDWLSLPLGASVLHEKPVALMGASPGPLGTARCQWDLRNTFIYSRSPVTPSPEVMLRNCWEHFDEQGNIINPQTVARIELMFQTLRAYARVVRADDELVPTAAAITTRYPTASR
jgi:chromate reductase